MALDPREFAQFMTQAAVKLPGASNAGIKAELYDVIKEFLADSNAWVEDIRFQATADKSSYLLAPTTDGQIIRLVGVWDGNLCPVAAFMPVPDGTVNLLYAPDSTPPTTWTARVIKNVSLPTTNDAVPIAPDWLLRVYSVHILDGLLGKMMGQMNKSYTNSTMAVYHLKRFRTGIQIARTAAQRANLLGGQEWAYPRGWTSGSQRGGVSTAFPTRAF